MTAAEAREFLDAKPFRPFQVQHRDGRRFDVVRRNDAQAYRQHMLIAVDHDPETEIAETVEIIGWQDLHAARPLESSLAA